MNSNQPPSNIKLEILKAVSDDLLMPNQRDSFRIRDEYDFAQRMYVWLCQAIYSMLKPEGHIPEIFDNVTVARRTVSELLQHQDAPPAGLVIKDGNGAYEKLRDTLLADNMLLDLINDVDVEGTVDELLDNQDWEDRLVDVVANVVDDIDWSDKVGDAIKEDMIVRNMPDEVMRQDDHGTDDYIETVFKTALEKDREINKRIQEIVDARISALLNYSDAPLKERIKEICAEHVDALLSEDTHLADRVTQIADEQICDSINRHITMAMHHDDEVRKALDRLINQRVADLLLETSDTLKRA